MVLVKSLFFVVLSGVFHLIHATFQEYILLIVENQKMHVADKQLQKALQEHIKEGENSITLTNSC